MKTQRRRGFTVVELVVVIAIIAVLAAVLIPTFTSIIKKANDSAALQERTNQRLEDIAQKVDNANWLSWDDFEAKLAEELTKLNVGASKTDIENAIKVALDKYAESHGSSNTGLTEAQVEKIVKESLAGQVTEAQVQAIVEEAIRKINVGGSLSAADVKAIVNAAIAKVPTGVSASQVSSAINAALAKLDLNGLTADQVNTLIVNALENALSNTLTEEDVAEIIKNYVPTVIDVNVGDSIDFEKFVSGSTLNLVGNWESATLTIETERPISIIISGSKLGTLNINAKNASVFDYVSENTTAEVEAIAQASLHVYGKITSLTMRRGRVVLERHSVVENLDATPTENQHVHVVISDYTTADEIGINTSASNSTVNLENAGTVQSLNITAVLNENKPTVQVENKGTVAAIETNASPSNSIQFSVTGVAKTDGITYETLEEAIAAAKDGSTIVILEDITSDNGYKIDKANATINLDLNGKTIRVNSGSNVNSRAFRIDNGTLKVYGGGTIYAFGSGTNSSNGSGCYGAFRVEANGVVYVTDVTLINSRPWGLNVKVLGGEAYLTDVTVISSYGGGIEVTEADLGEHSKPGYALVKNCTFTQTGYFDHCSTCLSVSGGSKLVVDGGSYIGDNYALYVFSSGGEIDVKDGVFAGKNKSAIISQIDTNTYPEYTGAVKLNGGNYTIGGFFIGTESSCTITGGTYNVDPTAYVANGCSVNDNGNGTWTVYQNVTLTGAGQNPINNPGPNPSIPF